MREKKSKKKNIILTIGVVLIIAAAIVKIPLLFNDIIAGAEKNSSGSLSKIENTVRNNQSENENKNILLLVNKENPLSAGYRPNDLVTVNVRFNSSASAEEKMMRKDAALALEELFKGAHRDGIELYGLNGYRSYNTQQTLYNKALIQNGRSYTEKYIAKPGFSEHQTGLAMDVTNRTYSTSFETTKEGKWLAKNCYKYGFILRYPLDKQSITGYNYEPWHIRYVGKSAAKEIFSENISLEEYLKS